jgi:hypothetical protein
MAMLNVINMKLSKYYKFFNSNELGLTYKQLVKMDKKDIIDLVDKNMSVLPLLEDLDLFIKREVNNPFYSNKIVHLEVYEKSAEIEFDETQEVAYVHIHKIDEAKYLNGILFVEELKLII